MIKLASALLTRTYHNDNILIFTLRIKTKTNKNYELLSKKSEAVPLKTMMF